MKESFEHKHYPVEYLKFKCRTNEEALEYIEANEIWTNALCKKAGFISTSSYLNQSNPGEVHIVIVWETLESWLSIEKDELKLIDQAFNQRFKFPYESLERLHIETNFGLYKVRHDLGKGVK